jgi:hypothetical protein
MILEYIRCIQSDEDMAPSDTCLFVTNFTLRLFIRIALWLPTPHISSWLFQRKYISFLHQLSHVADISPAKQFISKNMVKELDPSLLGKMFQHDEKNSLLLIFFI